MNTYNYQISLSFEQILKLIKQLPIKEKEKLGKELAKENIERRLSLLLNSFKTDELSQYEIDSEIEVIRAELYAKKKKD